MNKLILELLNEDFLCQIGTECDRKERTKIKKSPCLRQKILDFDPTLCQDKCRGTASSLIEQLILKHINEENVEQLSIMCDQVTIKIFGYGSPSKSVFLSKLKGKIKHKHPQLMETIQSNYMFCGNKEESEIRNNIKENKEHKHRKEQIIFTTEEVKQLSEYLLDSKCPWTVLMGLGLITGSRKVELLCASSFYNYGLCKQGTIIAMTNHVKDRNFKDPHCNMSMEEIKRRRNLTLPEQTEIAEYEQIHGLKNPEMVTKPLLFLPFQEFETLLLKNRNDIKISLNKELCIFPRTKISAEASHKIKLAYKKAHLKATPELQATMDKLPNFHSLRACYASTAWINFNPTCSKTLYLKEILGHMSEKTSAIYDSCCVTTENMIEGIEEDDEDEDEDAMEIN